MVRLSIGDPRSVASITIETPGACPSTSRPKNGTPVRPTWRRGSRSAVWDSMTKTRPVIAPGCVARGIETSNRSGVMASSDGWASGVSPLPQRATRTPITQSLPVIFGGAVVDGCI